MKSLRGIGLLGLAVLILCGPAARADETILSGRAELESSTLVRGEVYAHFMRAQLAQRGGEYRPAAAEVRRAIELMPEAPEVLIEGAVLLQRMGRLEDAEDTARKALRLEPDHQDGLLFLADLVATRALRPGRPDVKSRDEALALYVRLLDLGVRNEDMLRKVISLRLQAEDRAGALAAAELLVHQRPGDRHAAGLLAQLLLESGEHREALRVLLAFVVRHPGDEPLLKLAEELARELEAWDLVEEVFAEHDQLGNGAGDAHRLRGEALLRLDRFEPASRALEKVLLTDPTDRAVRYTLARTYKRLGRLGEAATLARELADEAPTDAGLHLLAAEILDEQGDVHGALNAFNTALRLFSADPSDARALEVRDAIRRRMAVLYGDNEQPDAALQLLERMERPETPDAIRAEARLALSVEDWSAARQAARRLRSAGDPGVGALIEGEALLRSGRGARAVQKFEEAIEALGPRTRIRIADLYLTSEMREEGEAQLRDWVGAEPDSAEARFHLGSFLYRADDLTASETELRAAFRLDPEHSAALNFLGYSLAERGSRLDEALALVQRALAVDAWNGAYLDSLGWVYFRMGRYDDAREPLEQAARTYPKDPVVLEHLGDLYHRVGERTLALAAWSRALEAGADDPGQIRSKMQIVEVAEEESSSTAQDPDSE